MNTNIINLDGEQITVTQYGADDFDISFRVGDFSVRGSMLDVVKTFAEWQWCELDEPVVSFEHNDRTISNPWIDESARFPLDSAEASETYGLDNVFRFIIDACLLLRPTGTETEATV